MRHSLKQSFSHDEIRRMFIRSGILESFDTWTDFVLAIEDMLRLLGPRQENTNVSPTDAHNQM